jgi:hypothetical protein
VHSKEKDEACLGFLVKIFTKSLHKGGVICDSNEVEEISGKNKCIERFFRK